MHIVIRNSVIIVEGYNIGDCPDIERYFSILDPINYTYTMVGMRYDDEKQRLYLPRGVDISFIQNLLGGCDIIVDDSFDEYDKMPPISIKYLPRDDDQKEALEFVLGKGKYINQSIKTQLCLNLRTGKGKTYITIAALCFLNVRSCIIASNKEWLEQWKNCFLEYTNMDEREILIINGSIGIFKILKGHVDISGYRAFMITHASLNSFAKKHGWETITELFQKLRIYMKVFDEAHLNFTNISNVDFMTNTRKTLYLTATPARSDSSENFIYNLYFKNIPSIDLFDEENDPHTRYNSIRFASMPTPQQRFKIVNNNAYGFNRLAYTDYIVNNPVFYKMMYVIMNKVLNIDGKVLLYIGTNEAILKVKEWIETEYPEFRNNIGIFTSFVPQSEKRSQLEKRIILTTTKSAGPAVDIKGLKASFVLAEPFKSEVLAVQTLGRTRDNNTDYFELVDDSFKKLSSFYTHKKPVFRKHATECKEFRLNTHDLNNLSESLKAQREYVKEQYANNCPIISYKVPKENDND